AGEGRHFDRGGEGVGLVPSTDPGSGRSPAAPPGEGRPSPPGPPAEHVAATSPSSGKAHRRRLLRRGEEVHDHEPLIQVKLIERVVDAGEKESMITSRSFRSGSSRHLRRRGEGVHGREAHRRPGEHRRRTDAAGHLGDHRGGCRRRLGYRRQGMHTGDVLGQRSGARMGAPPPIEAILRSARRLASRRPEKSHGSGR
ncbi:MAG: hypothetical protein QOF81_1484, partial [Acidimicrobiaceae bacterium]|nr:hypothetical protein [Acidimicrobiaceae bacterium]